MDYEGTRDTAPEVPMGEIALGQPSSNLTAAAAASASVGGTLLIPDANNTVVLPDGASLDDITVRGRDLVIQLDDGRIFIIPDGAVFVPQIVAQGVTVPPLNLAALLIGQEPEPAAGPVRSSGGNFAVPVDPLQDAYDLGDLLPYTELKFPDPRQREIFPDIDRQPETTPNAVVLLDDDALAGGNAGGTGDDPDSANTSGTLTGSGGDGALTWALATTGAPAGFSYVANGTGLDIFQGETLVVRVTLNTATGAYTVTQVAVIDHAAGADENNQLFTLNYSVTDTDGDTAPGTIDISVDDDTPVARNDTDTVAAGTYGPETGNVLTGAGTTSGTAGADSMGADTGTLTGVRPGTAGSFVAPGGSVIGTFGTLTLNPDGGYSYVRNPGTPGGVSDVFTYQLTDGDGDVTTATLTINIADALPLTAANAAALLDDDALAGGIAGGTGDDVDAANLIGTLSGSGGDGPLIWALATTGAPAGFSFVANGTGIDILQGSTVVVRVTLNTATGAYTVTQLAPIQHVAGSDENNQAFTLSYSVTDVDGDAASGSLAINVDDDTPTVAVIFEGQVSALIVDETNLVGTAAENFAGMFEHNFGADGAGTIGYALGVTAGPSGLIDTLSGENVVLSMNGGVTEGRTATGGLLVFTASVDASGNVTLNQYRAVVHSPDAGPDDVVSIASSLVTLTQTVTDRDGDPVSATANIGAFLNFVDDAPDAENDSDSIASGTYGPATGNVLTDASAGDTGDADTGADALGNDGATVTAITGFGGDGAIGGTTTGQYGVLTLNPDGSYSYVRNPGTAGGVSDVFIYTVTDGDGDTDTATLTIAIADALPVTAPNATALLDDDALAGGNPGGLGDDVNAANLTGTLAASGGDGPLTWALLTTGAPAGFSYVANGSGINVLQGATLVMQVTLNPTTGAYTVTQVAAIDHAAGGDENNLAFTFNYSVTDQDGDSADGTLGVNIDDDTPVLADDTDTIASGTYGPATGNVLTDASAGDAGDADTGADSVGADGGTLTAIAGFGGAGAINGTTTGQYGVLTLNDDGSYSYTRNPGTPGGVTDTFTYTATDGDGDTATATLIITIEDALPITAANAEVLLDDDALAGGNAGGTGDDINAANLTGTLAASGGDGPLTWALTTTGAPAGFSYVANGTGLDVFQGGTLVMQVTLNTATGAYAVTQIAAIDHTAGADENNTEFSFSYTVTDQDGDTANGSLAVNVDDDTPVLANDTDTIASGTYGPATGNVLTDASAGDAGDTDTGADSLGADGGTLTAITGFGGAGAINGTTTGQYGVLTLNDDGSYSYTRNAGTPGGVTDTFTYTVTDGDGDTATATLVISIADARPLTGPDINVQTDDDIFSGNPGGTGDDPDAVNLTGFLTGSGGDGPLSWTLGSVVFAAPFNFAVNFVSPVSYQITQNSVVVLTITIDGTTGAYTIVQNAPIQHVAGLDENNTLLRINYITRDQDGDFANGFINVNLDDDTAVLANDTDEILSGSSAPATGNVLTDASAGDAGDSDTGADSVGADGGTITAITGFGGAGSIGGTTNGQYGVLTLNLDGSYSYTRNAGTPGNVSDVFTYTVTDGDGDVATATLTIAIEDARPFTAPNAVVLLDDDALAGGNPGGTGDDANAANTSGTLSGSGGDGALTWALLTTGAPAGFSYVANGTGINVLQGGTLVMQVTLNPATGAYTVTQVAAIDHTALGDENNQAFTLNYTVSDADGDSAPGTLAINVDDDTPLAANDTDTIASGSYGPATGNILTDASAGDAGDTDTGADSLGADGGTLTAITGFGGAGSIGGTTTGQYGVLTLQPNGGYSYTRNPGTPGGVTDTFTYTVTDGDGDTATATLIITIADALPVTAANATVLLDDDALAGGNPGGTGDDVNAANTSGTLAASGGDGPLTWALATTGAPAGFSYVANGTGLNVFQGATLVMQVTLNPATGAYTVTQVAAIDHTALGDENNQVLSLAYSVTDQDGDVANGTLAINVDDDTPLAANDTDTIASGSYGPATGNILTDASAGDAGDTDTGADSMGADGGSLTAITGFGGAGAIGGTTTGQYGVLTLNADGSYSYTRNAGTPGGVSDTFTYTITDGDGDTAQATLIITIADALPLATPNAAVLLDDDALAGGNPGGGGDDIDAANLSGTLGATGGDGPLTWALLTTGAPSGFSYVANGTGLNILQGTTLVMQVTLNTATGAYTVTQVAPIMHANATAENNQLFTLNYSVTDRDNDVANGTLAINVDDDSPTASASGTQPTLVVDETLLGTDASASFAGVFTAAFGADGPALANSLVYTLGINAGASGLFDVATGLEVVLAVESGQVVGRAGAGGAIVFTLSVAANGTVTLDQQRAVQHNDPLDPDEPGDSAAMLLSDTLITLAAVATDRDGDPVTAIANIGRNLQFEDDGPSISSVTSPLAIANSGTVSGTGSFVFTTGNDGAAGTDDAIKTVTFGGTVNGVAVTSPSIVAGVENATTANYTFSFTYATGAGTTATATGTLVFDKTLGTYTVDLDGPIQSFTVSGTASGTAFIGYELNSATLDGSQPTVSVTQISPNLFLQFTSVAEPSSGTGTDNLGTVNYGLDGTPPNDGSNLSFSNGELFNQAAGWVSISNTANGVNGDTIGGGEVLDFNLYNSNPLGFVGTVPTASTSTMYLKFDGIGTGEDFIMLLKLWNPATGEYTTRAIMVQNSDIQKGPGAGPGVFSGITLDNNDGLIVIEANDYNLAGENFMIVGAQIAGSDEGISGSAYNFNNATGAGGGSTTAPLQAFSTDINNGPMKISDIGFVTVTSTAQPAQLTFDVTVQDRDGDTESETLVVNIGAAPAPAEPLSTKSGATTSSFAEVEKLDTRSAELLAASTAATGLLAAMALEQIDPAGAELASASPDLEVSTLSALQDPAGDQGEAIGADTGTLDHMFSNQAPVEAGHSIASEETAALSSALDKAGDRFAGEHFQLGGDAGRSELFDYAENAMNALLAKGAFAASGGMAQVSDPAIAAALTDSADAQVVDSIVDHFAGPAEAMPEQLGQDAGIGFENLLQLGVSGGGADFAGMGFGKMQTIDHEEANAMA